MDVKTGIKLIRTIIVSGLAFVVNYGISLILTPYITTHVGTEAYGFVSIARQFAQYATIITIALNSFASRHITVAFYRSEIKKANEYFSSAFFGDVILATAIFCAAGCLVYKLEYVINIPQELVPDVKWLFLLVFVNFWFSTVFSAFEASAYIKNKLDLVGLCRALSYLTEAAVLFVIYKCSPAHVCYVGIGLIAATLVVGLSNCWITRRFTPELAVSKSNYSRQTVKRLVSEGVWNSISTLGDTLNTGLDLLTCNLLLSPLSAGQLAIAKTIYSIFSSLYVVVSQAFQPMFLREYSTGNTKKLLQALKLSMKVSSLLSNVVFAGFVSLGMAYYQLWIPNEDIELVYRLTVLTVVICIPGGIMHPLYYIYTLTVKKKIPCIVTLIGGATNVIGMFFLIKYTGLGVYAVALTTVGVMFVTNYIVNPIYMAHVLALPHGTFYPPLLRCTLSCMLMTAIFKLFAELYFPSSWLELICCAAVYTVCGAVLHLFVAFEPSERAEIRRVLHHEF